MITKLSPKCVCGRHLAPVEGGDDATFHARRTCRKCGIVWAVVVEPGIKLGGASWEGPAGRTPSS